MDQNLEFSAQAFSKMIMHAVRYPHAVCSGFLLSTKPQINTIEDKTATQTDQGDARNTDSNVVSQDSHKSYDIIKKITTIIDIIPVSHASHGLATNLETAFNSVNLYAQDQDLIVSGYYQTDRNNESSSYPDVFCQKIMDKICELHREAVLCLINFDGDDPKTLLVPHQFVDGKWRRKPKSSYRVEIEPGNLCQNIVYSKERLYRHIVDFDEHFNDISLDWTNAKLSQQIDHLIANAC